jgi:hypothetical protein
MTAKERCEGLVTLLEWQHATYSTLPKSAGVAEEVAAMPLDFAELGTRREGFKSISATPAEIFARETDTLAGKTAESSVRRLSQHGLGHFWRILWSSTSPPSMPASASSWGRSGVGYAGKVTFGFCGICPHFGSICLCCKAKRSSHSLRSTRSTREWSEVAAIAMATHPAKLPPALQIPATVLVVVSRPKVAADFVGSICLRPPSHPPSHCGFA